MKKWYMSWTIRVNALVIAGVAALTYLADVAVQPEVSTILLAVANLLLRFKTDTGVER